MRRIKYPYNDDFEKEIFITSYYNLIKKNIDVVQLEKTLSCIDSEYNLKKLLTCDFVDLLAMSKKIKESSHEKKLKDFFIKNNKPIKYLYDDYQLKISSFLMDNSINLNTCHYCNIDFINTIEQRYQFNSIKDFILNAPYEVLMLVKEIKANENEPPARVYKIAHAVSVDGVNWQKEDGKQIIADILNEDECQALPTVLKIGNRYHMYFCFRQAT
ncbi:MAG: hypothetical protein ABI793_03865, partial [Flavobacterium sp.]